MRAPFQVNVFAYRIVDGQPPQYAIFHRADATHVWQAIAGGGEDNETPAETAIRESGEEGGIPAKANFIELDSRFSVPAPAVRGFLWGPEVLVLPLHYFGVDATDHEIALSEEHTEFEWCSYDRAISKLTFDSDKLALWELNHRLTQMG